MEFQLNMIIKKTNHEILWKYTQYTHRCARLDWKVESRPPHHRGVDGGGVYHVSRMIFLLLLAPSHPHRSCTPRTDILIYPLHLLTPHPRELSIAKKFKEPHTNTHISLDALSTNRYQWSTGKNKHKHQWAL